MTVPAYTGPNTSTANGVTTTFPYSFKILAASDLLVTVNGLVRTLGLHYSVTGVGEAGGGDVVFFDPPASGAIVDRRRNMPLIRSINYANLGDLLASTLNEDQDSPVLMIQQLAAAAMALILDPDSNEFVWDAKGSRIIRVGDATGDTDALNYRSALSLIEQVQDGGGSVGVTPKFWEWTGDGESTDFPIPGADVTDPLFFDTAMEDVASSGDYFVVKPTGFSILPAVGDSDPVIRFPVAPALGVRGFTTLRGFARPWIGQPPIYTVAPTIVTSITSSTTIDATRHNALILISSATDVVLTIRKNTGDGTLDWKDGQFFMVCPIGTGKVTLAIESGGELLAATDFNLQARARNSIVTATCVHSEADAWRAAGDLLRNAVEPTKQVLRLLDRAVLIGTNIATGTSKDSFVMPYDFQLDAIADRGLYASLSVAQAAGNVVTVDVNVDGTSIIDTKMTFDNNEKTTLTAAMPPVFSSAFTTANRIIPAGSEVTIDVDQIGTALAKGLSVYLRGQRAN